jgi:hypothetical protein
VCDKRGDKGVDGIFVNDYDRTITIFQARISQTANTTIGDKSLREFAGTISQFETIESIQNLINSAPSELVAKLARRLDLENKIATHDLRGEFLVNVDLDANGESFLRTASHISFVGKTIIQATYISDRRDTPIHKSTDFDVLGFHVTEYTVDASTKAVIAPIKATELVALDGTRSA